VRVGAGLGVGVGVLLEEPGGQVAAEVAGPLLALVEGDELVLGAGVEQQVEGSGGVGEPAPAEFLPLGVGGRWSIVQDGYSRGRIKGKQALGYPTRSTPAQERDCTFRRGAT
jgi:hypothetical protein